MNAGGDLPALCVYREAADAPGPLQGRLHAWRMGCVGSSTANQIACRSYCALFQGLRTTFAYAVYHTKPRSYSERPVRQKPALGDAVAPGTACTTG